jgi:hypothetical protein
MVSTFQTLSACIMLSNCFFSDSFFFSSPSWLYLPRAIPFLLAPALEGISLSKASNSALHLIKQSGAGIVLF